MKSMYFNKFADSFDFIAPVETSYLKAEIFASLNHRPAMKAEHVHVGWFFESSQLTFNASKLKLKNCDY